MTYLRLRMARQPDDRTCGATCLHALYRHYGDEVSLESLGDEIPQLPGGGTMGVHLANHALARGYEVDVYTYNLQLFDPSWFDGKTDIADRLVRQLEYERGVRLEEATRAYLDFFATYRTVVAFGDRAVIEDEAYLGQLGLDPTPIPGSEVWGRLLDAAGTSRPDSSWADDLSLLLEQGPLARRLLRTLPPDPRREDLRSVAGELVRCLAANTPFRAA